MKIPDWDPKEIREIAECEARLRKEAESIGYRKKLLSEKLEQLLQANNKEGMIGSFTTAAAESVKFQVDCGIQLAVIRRILDVLLKHLGEAGHAEAVRALRQLRIQDIVEQ